jgi:hypothetical protein
MAIKLQYKARSNALAMSTVIVSTSVASHPVIHRSIAPNFTLMGTMIDDLMIHFYGIKILVMSQANSTCPTLRVLMSFGYFTARNAGSDLSFAANRVSVFILYRWRGARLRALINRDSHPGA